MVLRCFSGFGGSPVVNGAAEFSFFRDVLTIYGATKPVTCSTNGKIVKRTERADELIGEFGVIRHRRMSLDAIGMSLLQREDMVDALPI